MILLVSVPPDGHRWPRLDIMLFQTPSLWQHGLLFDRWSHEMFMSPVSGQQNLYRADQVLSSVAAAGHLVLQEGCSKL